MFSVYPAEIYRTELVLDVAKTKSTHVVKNFMKAHFAQKNKMDFPTLFLPFDDLYPKEQTLQAAAEVLALSTGGATPESQVV